MICKRSLPSQTIPWLSEGPAVPSSPCQWGAGLVPHSSQLTGSSLLSPTWSLPSAEEGWKCSGFLCDSSAADSGNLKGSLCSSLPHNDTSPILNPLINFEGSREKTWAQFKNVNNPHDQMGWALMYPSLQMMLFIFNCSTYRLVRQQHKYTLGAWQGCLGMRHGGVGKAEYPTCSLIFLHLSEGFQSSGWYFTLSVRGDAEASPHMRLCSSPCSWKNFKIFSTDSKFSLLITGRMVQI